MNSINPNLIYVQHNVQKITLIKQTTEVINAYQTIQIMITFFSNREIHRKHRR